MLQNFKGWLYLPTYGAKRKRYGLLLFDLFQSVIKFFNFLNFYFILFVLFFNYFSRYGLERNYNSTTVFTLHLAFIDLCFCLICMPQYTFAYLNNHWPFGELVCEWSGPIIFLVTFVDWICLGFIALSRCLSMTRPKMWNIL